MAVKFDHFILTRFNVRVAADSTPASPEWLEHRLKLFKSICVRSVLSQSDSRFRWLVFLDANSPGWFVDQVERLALEGRFETVWVDGVFTGASASKAVDERAEERWIITSRLDNDDAIARDFVSVIRENFSGEAVEFFNFASGLQLTVAGKLYRRMDPSNAFASFVEDRHADPLRTVFIDGHHRLIQHGAVRQLQGHPMWLQMIHDQNIANQAHGIRVDGDLLHAHFDVDAPVEHHSPLQGAALFVGSAASLMARVIVSPRRLIWLGRVVVSRIRR